ncbi:hypothetical protein TorRG33x02_306180 [Trema orientale]|uniref:Homologous recombination OB-fold protein OB-fold domain-containing protein n=1 Tax=Trema orientale TaxID=63057 RepID=A0A2P5BWI3_TREOI|nr:hypothetical protein TorRG33x02_306180 [Trema orientale]
MVLLFSPDDDDDDDGFSLWNFFEWKVVAIIKSCTPNGLGGLMVTLTDNHTLGASINRKVLCEGELVKIISTGAVVVLQQSTTFPSLKFNTFLTTNMVRLIRPVFTPVHSAYYLNINNATLVIAKDSGPPMTQNGAPSSLRYTAECFDIPVPVRSQERTEGIMKNLRKSSEFRGSMTSNRTMEGLAVPETEVIIYCALEAFF